MASDGQHEALWRRYPGLTHAVHLEDIVPRSDGAVQVTRLVSQLYVGFVGQDEGTGNAAVFTQGAQDAALGDDEPSALTRRELVARGYGVHSTLGVEGYVR